MRDLRILAAAAFVSAIGDFAAFVALVTTVHDHTGSGLAVAGLFIALWGPIAVLGGPAGRLVDRLENRALVLVMSLVQATAALALAFTTDLAAILPLVALLGSATTVAQPAEFALVPAAVGEDAVARANGRLEAARAVGFTLGPLLGGAFAAAGQTRGVLLLDAASFLAVAAGAAVLRARRRHARDRTPPVPLRNLLREDRALVRVLAAALASLVFMTISGAVEVFFAKDVLHAGDLGFAALITAWTAGMVAGAGGVAPRVALPASGAIAAIAIQGAGLATAAAVPVLVVALFGYGLGGVAHGAKNVLIRTLLHQRVPESRRGGAFAAYNAARNAVELGALLSGGVLLGVVGARTSLFIAGFGAVVVGAVAHRSITTTKGDAPCTPHPTPSRLSSSTATKAV